MATARIGHDSGRRHHTRSRCAHLHVRTPYDCHQKTPASARSLAARSASASAASWPSSELASSPDDEPLLVPACSSGLDARSSPTTDPDAWTGNSEFGEPGMRGISSSSESGRSGCGGAGGGGAGSGCAASDGVVQCSNLYSARQKGHVGVSPAPAAAIAVRSQHVAWTVRCLHAAQRHVAKRLSPNFSVQMVHSASFSAILHTAQSVLQHERKWSSLASSRLSRLSLRRLRPGPDRAR
eukprot:1974588-Prymnesium_polylepis.1